jgi:hypothetical protein
VHLQWQWQPGAAAAAFITPAAAGCANTSSFHIQQPLQHSHVYSVSLLQAMEAAWTRCIDLAPTNAAAWSNRGAARMQAARWQEAYDDFQHSAALEQEQGGQVRAPGSHERLQHVQPLEESLHGLHPSRRTGNTCVCAGVVAPCSMAAALTSSPGGVMQ